MKRKKFAPIIILVLIALVAAGYFAYKNYWLKSQSFFTTNSTANWRTHTSPDKKFEFKYPPGWNIYPSSITANEQVSFQSPNTGGTLLRFFNGPVENFEQIFNWGIASKIGQQLTDNKHITYTKLNEFNLSENKVLVYSVNVIETGMEETYYDYIVRVGDKYYVFEFYHGNASGQPIDITKEKPSFDQILSTFKFLDQPPTESSGKYTCPVNGWQNCMPILSPEGQAACSLEAMEWYKANCPNFKGAAL